MTPVDMRQLGERGDCMRACLASILDLPLDDVPDFVNEGDPAFWFGRAQSWLRPQGKRMVWVDPSIAPFVNVDEAVLHIKVGFANRASIALNETHAVVGLGETIVHDPHPSRAGLAEVREFFFLNGYA
jgi:hypothetical protein